MSRDTITTKEKKYSRDFKAFASNKTYVRPTFQPRQPYRGLYNPTPTNRPTNETVLSDSSSSSVTSYSSSSHFPYRNMKQARKRYKGQDHNRSPEWKRRIEHEHMGD